MLQKRIEKIKLFSSKYKIYLMPIVLVVGFLLDFVTLRRVDGVFDNLILISHLFIVGLAIILLFGKDTIWGQRIGILKHSQKIEYVMFFSFGAIFSGSIIFFSKSAYFGTAWPFFLILLILMLGTEFKKKYFQRLVFQINFYFIALFSYLIVLIPVIKKVMGPAIFIASGIFSIILIFLFFLILYMIDKQRFLAYFKKMIISIFSIFLFFNFLYFTNIIPPIPLSLKFSGVYHSVYKSSLSKYVGIYEPNPWWNLIQKRSKTVNRVSGEAVYVFSAVFAPTNLNTKIYHKWQYFDPVSYAWVDSSRIEISISGGRQDGFRGFSFKRNLENGKWRVIIETERGQRLGQIKFKITTKNKEIVLKEEIL